MRMRLAYLLTLLVGIMCITSMAEARELPEVVWSNMVCGVDNDKEGKENWHLLTDEGRDRIKAAVHAKLLEQQKAGKLPFKLAEGNWDVDKIDSSTPVGIVPIVTTNSMFHQEFDIGNKKLHKYVLASALDIAVCSFESDGQTLRMLYNIPLHFWTSVPENNRLEDMRLLSREEERDLYARFTVKMIEQHLDFSKMNKVMRKLEDKVEAAEATYQVTNINISSPKAQEIFTGSDGLGQARITNLKKIIGDIYTSAYAQRTGHVVYPSLLSGNWVPDAVKGCNVLRLNTGNAGELRMVVKNPDQGITLDITGVGRKEAETKKKSNINGFMAYKVWLAKSPKENEKETEVTNAIVQEFDRYHGKNLGLSDRDIFRMLLIGAAEKLGSQKLK